MDPIWEGKGQEFIVSLTLTYTKPWGGCHRSKWNNKFTLPETNMAETPQKIQCQNTTFQGMPDDYGLIMIQVFIEYPPWP